MVLRKMSDEYRFTKERRVFTAVFVEECIP
jgi:hypothetical protein